MDIPHLPRRTRPTSQRSNTPRPLRTTITQASTARNHTQTPFFYLPIHSRETAMLSPVSTILIQDQPVVPRMICAECLRDFQDVVKAEDSNLYLCGLCHEKERVHWRILLSADIDEQALLARILRVIER